MILWCNIALICFINPVFKACASPSSEVHQRELPRHGGCTRCVSRKGGTGTSGGWRLGESSAALSTLMLGGFTFQAPLLSLFGAGDTVEAREIGGAQMEKEW